MSQQRHVIIRGQVYRWEEKQPFTKSGKSILGAIEYDRATDSLKCHECGEWRQWLGRHIGCKHSGVKEYKVKYGLRSTASLLGPEKKVNFYQTPEKLAQLAHLQQAPRRKMNPSLYKRRKQGFLELRNERNVCEAQLLFRLKHFVLQHGTTPTVLDLPADLRDALFDRFGRLSVALEQIGIRPNKKFYSPAVLIEDLRDFYVLNQRLPRTGDWGTGRLASTQTYQKFFGSIYNSFEEAGLGLVAEEEQRKRIYTKDQLVKALQDFYALNQRLPINGEWNNGHQLPRAHTYIKHFGGMAEAFNAAGLALVARQDPRHGNHPRSRETYAMINTQAS